MPSSVPWSPSGGASNWLVDDEAATTLIANFCARLADAEKQAATADYAEALRQANRRIRRQEGWESPFFWGAFVLVGPN
jgi:CHAT domain-containing protein